MKHRLFYVVGQLGLGGLERQLFYLIRSMNRARYKPIVAVWGDFSHDHYARELRALDVPVVGLGPNPARLAKLRRLSDLVANTQPEVIHSYTFYTNFASWWAGQGSGAIAIGSVRNSFMLDCREAGKVFGRLCGRWPATQIFNSFAAERNARQSTRIFRPRSPYVVTNGVDLDHFAPRPFPRKGYILAVGSLYPRKRWDRLIRAVATLTSKGLQVQVVHVGAGPLREELDRMVRDLRVESSFKFLGNRHDINDLLANAMFLVHTADDEGCPNVVMETMACGRAVVATDAGDIPYLVDDGKTGFMISREDEVALASRMEALWGDHEMCRQMGEVAREKAERTFGIERLRSETFSVYQAEGWKDS